VDQAGELDVIGRGGGGLDQVLVLLQLASMGEWALSSLTVDDRRVPVKEDVVEASANGTSAFPKEIEDGPPPLDLPSPPRPLTGPSDNLRSRSSLQSLVAR